MLLAPDTLGARLPAWLELRGKYNQEKQFHSRTDWISHSAITQQLQTICTCTCFKLCWNYLGTLRLWGIWCKLRPREDRGENHPLGLKVCLRSTGEAENWNCGVVWSVVWKSPPDSSTVDSDWYGLCFNLDQFTLHFSWHILGCMNFVLVSPDMFVCIPHVYHTRESTVRVYTMETPRECIQVYTDY